MSILENKKIVLSIIILLLVITIGSLGATMYFYNESKNDICLEECNDYAYETEEVSNWYVEVKGAVKKPGVFNVSEGIIVNDVIKMAGGFNKNAYTNNINLSKKVSDELVIYVYTKSEYQKSVSVSNNVINKPNDITSGDIVVTPSEGKININTASLDELSKLPGLGEKKAQTIIEYRNTNGLFKAIEDITNVSGIGTATYEKLKELITI